MAKILPPQVVEESSLQAGRVKASTIIKPIVYGNVARYFGKKREEDGHTHQWTVYLKPLLNEDMSTWIKKVHFKLHESYENQNRIILVPPYEVTETGWGEFEIVIKVYFHDPNERPVTLYHVLKLFQTANSSDGSSGPPQPCPSRKALVAETYDEIIFSEPTLHMHQLLTQPPLPVVPGPWRHETDIEAKHKKSLEQILAAKQKIRKEISELKEKIKSTRETIDMFKQQMGQHEPAQS